MKLPQSGQSSAAILEQLAARKQDDVPWAEGKVFAYIYDAGDEAKELLHQAYGLYMIENGLDPTSFPSCLELEKDVIGMAVELMNGGDDATGTFTSGGTESILLSLKTARDFYREQRPEITAPEVLMPTTAHPAFHKACAYFDLKAVTVPVDDDFRANPAAMAAAVTDNTIMLVGSAPSYAHGVVDPIEALGELALKHDILFHVDCCVGGMYLPFAKKLGYDIPAYDFSVPGVTQMSLDFHKWGYAIKGASCVLYKQRELRRHQIFAHAQWAGYAVINPGVTSSKSGGPVAACWAILNYLGEEGYLRIVEQTHTASRKIIDAVAAIEGLEVMGEPSTNMFALRATDFDIFPLAEDMKERGWYIQPQFGYDNSVENLHISVGMHNVHRVDEFIADLSDVAVAQRAAQQDKEAFVLPDELREFIEQAGPSALDHMGDVLGSTGDSLPGRMDEINQILNQLPAPTREVLLSEFINRLYNPQ
jgi:glutamate/tyrosine decarboxylase-like PLP-dependent enzyme